MNWESENPRPGARVRAIALITLVATMLAVWPLQGAIDRLLDQLPPTQTTLYFTSGSVLRRWTLGYNGLLADLYWTRAVQYYGRRRLAGDKHYPLLGDLLWIATDLDPHLLIAYRFGAIFLSEKSPDGAGEPQTALQLIRRGIVANPSYWRLWEDLGFTYYWDLKDYPMAARALETGSRQPGAYVWMKAMAAAIAAQGREYNTSRLLWTEIYQTAQTRDVRASALAHLQALDAKEQISELTQLVGKYRRATGRLPRSFDDLISSGYLQRIPVDPTGVPYVLSADGRVSLGPNSKVDLSLAE